MKRTGKRPAITRSSDLIEGSARSPDSSRIGRREFLRAGACVSLTAVTMGTLGRGGAQSAEPGDKAETLNMRYGATDLVVQPVLMYEIRQRQPGKSWRSWTGLQTEEAVQKEATRIERELKELAASADFGVRMLPLAKVRDKAEAEALKGKECDAILLYAAGGGTDLLNTLAGLGKRMIIFVRHLSGPYYLWSEIVHSRFLRSHTDHVEQPNVSLEDVVVDDNKEILWRLRALYGLKNTVGRKIVCVGGPGGWACPQAPELARERFNLDMLTVTIPEINALIVESRKNEKLMARCQEDMKKYLAAGNVKLKTTEVAVREAFLLKRLFQDLMAKSKAYAVTTRGCMGSYAGIMPCMTLTLINDDGYMAYCEGDFVVIPSGMLTHFICGQPTYFCNPTFPRNGRMMFAHCTAPRRMDGKKLEPVELVTHYESDHGAATHVDFRINQKVTIVKPDFEAKNWLALTGKIVGTPFIDTCRAQVDVELEADMHDVVKNLRGFHCTLAYGDHTKEVAYAASKVGIKVQTLTA